MTTPVPADTPMITARLIAAGKGWRMEEVVCRAGPGDRAFEEAHALTSVAVVTQGRFTYRTTQGTALLAPGSLLLGNAGACFECGHRHSAGDHCIAFRFSPDLVEEVAATMRGVGSPRFANAAAPPADTLVPAIGAARIAAQTGDPMLAEQVALDVLSAAFAEDREARDAAPGARDLAAAAEAVRIIEDSYAEPLSIAGLADATGLTRRRFAQSFRAAVGVSPYHYVIARRLEAAAQRLRVSDDTVLDIALDAGFGDLSEFTRRFSARFGCPPAAFRKRMRAGGT